MLDQLSEIDSATLSEKHHQSTEICKPRRKYVKSKKVKSNDAFTHAEKVPSYKRGKFYEGAD